MKRHQIGSLLPAGAPGIEPAQSLRLHAIGFEITIPLLLSSIASQRCDRDASLESGYDTFYPVGPFKQPFVFTLSPQANKALQLTPSRVALLSHDRISLPSTSHQSLVA
jgi:hypothetical protein